MRLVAFEANGPRCSVALADENGPFMDWSGDLGNAVAGPMLGSLQSLLGTCDWSLSSVDVFAACVGPGSFTGVKIAVTLAKTLAHSLGVPTVGVGSLDAMSADVRAADVLVCLLPAKAGHLYLGMYRHGKRDGSLRMLSHDEALDALAEAAQRPPVFVTSPVEWDQLPEGCEQVGFSYPSATSVARVAVPRALRGEVVPAHALVPDYVASYSITKPKKPFAER
ncbi:MAG: hypothetical protein AMXMBFR61_19370 [Fimbriimonadales bacterium]